MLQQGPSFRPVGEESLNLQAREGSEQGWLAVTAQTGPPGSRGSRVAEMLLCHQLGGSSGEMPSFCASSSCPGPGRRAHPLSVCQGGGGGAPKGFVCLESSAPAETRKGVRRHQAASGCRGSRERALWFAVLFDLGGGTSLHREVTLGDTGRNLGLAVQPKARSGLEGAFSPRRWWSLYKGMGSFLGGRCRAVKMCIVSST